MTDDQRKSIDAEFASITGALANLEAIWLNLQLDNEQQAQLVRNKFSPVYLRLNKLFEATLPQDQPGT